MNSARTRISAAAVKQAVDAGEFYAKELTMPPPRPGREWQSGGRCPFHVDRRVGNFRINVRTGAFTCFSCGVRGGDIIAFTQALHGMSFPDALDELCDSWGVRP